MCTQESSCQVNIAAYHECEDINLHNDCMIKIIAHFLHIYNSIP